MAHPSAAKLRRIAKRSTPRSSDPSPNSSSSSLEALDDNVNANQNSSHVAVTAAAAAATTLPPISPSRSLPPPQSPSSPAVMSQRRRLLIASLGNPPPYLNTRHSIGHIALFALVSHLGGRPVQRSPEHANGSVSQPFDHPHYTFWQSPSMMNVSGVALLKTWRAFVHANTTTGADDMNSVGLVILHDELELPIGQVKVKRGSSSARGHNGLKSVQASLQGAGLLDRLGQNFAKMGIGIGRPQSRDRDDVSDYVLGKIDAKEKKAVEEVVVGRLASLLEQESARGTGKPR